MVIDAQVMVVLSTFAVMALFAPVIAPCSVPLIFLIRPRHGAGIAQLLGADTSSMKPVAVTRFTLLFEIGGSDIVSSSAEAI
jgi:hypothetical protein